MTRWFRVYVVSQIERFLQSKCARLRCSCLVSPDAYRRAGTGFTVLWCARAREVAQAARRMIAARRLRLISPSIKENDYATALKSTISATSMLLFGSMNSPLLRSISTLLSHNRRRCCGQSAHLCLLEGLRLPIFSEDATG